MTARLHISELICSHCLGSIKYLTCLIVIHLMMWFVSYCHTPSILSCDWLPPWKSHFLSSVWVLCIQTQAISTLEATFLICSSELVLSSLFMVRNWQIALLNSWNLTPVSRPALFQLTHWILVVGLSWIEFMVSTVPACEIGMWKAQSTVHGKSVLFCGFICVKVKKRGGVKLFIYSSWRHLGGWRYSSYHYLPWH